MMEHLEFSAAQLREAYANEGSHPGYGGWVKIDIDEEWRTYRCPLNIAYGAVTMDEAIRASGAPKACISAFLRGWDILPRATDGCAPCYRLGATLRTELKPVRI
jgi:hypothetical protein